MLDEEAGPAVEYARAPQQLPVSAPTMRSLYSRRRAVLLARICFGILILVNLAAGGALWLSKAEGIGQPARTDLSVHVARIETLLMDQDVLAPSVLNQLAAELAASQKDLGSLQGTVPVLGELGIGSSAGTAHALTLGLDMVQTGEELVAAARVLQPDLAGLADSILQGPGGAPHAGDSRLSVDDVQAAQQDIAQAKQTWQQALNDWGAFSSGVPNLSSDALNSIVRGMSIMSRSLTVALVATSAVLDWSPALLGLLSPENILLVEESPDVLRPTGGVITHYAVLTFAEGMLSSHIQLHSVAGLDCPQQVCAVSSLPAATTWIPVSRAPVQVGDANLDPDLTVSGWSIYNHFEQEGGPQVGGVIVATQNVFADILGAIGPVTIQGLPGEFTAGNVAVRMREVEADATHLLSQPVQGSTSAGDIDALMLSAILTKLKSVTPAQRVGLEHALVHALIAKDLQLFTSEERVQSSLIDMDLAGQVLSPPGDSLEIVDTNVNGSPVNPLIAESATDTVVLGTDGSAQHELSLTYHYAMPAGAISPPPTYADVVRVLVPNDAVAQQISGPCTPLQFTQAYHAVLACEVKVVPGGTVTLHFAWQAPLVWGSAKTDPQSYILLIERQPGADIDVRVRVNPPSGHSLSRAEAPGYLSSGQLAFSAAPLLTDTTLQAVLK